MARKQKQSKQAAARPHFQIEVVGTPDPYRMAVIYLITYGLPEAEAERRIAKIRRADEEAARLQSAIASDQPALSRMLVSAVFRAPNS